MERVVGLEFAVRHRWFSIESAAVARACSLDTCMHQKNLFEKSAQICEALRGEGSLTGHPDRLNLVLHSRRNQYGYVKFEQKKLPTSFAHGTFQLFFPSGVPSL